MSPGCTIRLVFFWVFLHCFSMLILSLTYLGLGSKSTSLSPGLCVRRPRQYDTICCKLDLISGFFVFYWADCLGGWNQSMWLVSSRRQGMLTQEPAPDPKCKLIISSPLTLSHLLYCFICIRNAMSILFLLQTNGGWDTWGGGGVEVLVLIYIRVWVGERGGEYHLIVFVFSCAFLSCSLTFSVLLFRWVEHGGSCVCFFVFFFISFVSGPFN